MTVQHATRTEDEDVMHTLYIHTVLYTRIHTPPAERFTIACSSKIVVALGIYKLEGLKRVSD
jgi:hypothetical protein